MSALRAAAASLALLLLASGPAESQEPTEEQLQRAVALHATALADMEAQNFGRAAASLRELATVLPDNVLPYVNLAICQFRLGETVAAVETIERAQQIDPDNLQALFALARILGEQVADDVDARRTWDRILRRMVQLAPGDARPHFLRARSLEERGRHEDAVTVLHEAVRHSPDNLVLLSDLLFNASRAGLAETTSDAVDAIEDRLNGFEDQEAEYADAVRDAAFLGDAGALRPPSQVLQNLLRPTELYQVGLAELQGREGGVFLFPQLDFVPALPKSVQGGADLELRFGAAQTPWDIRDAVALTVERAPGAERLLAQLRGGRLVRLSRDGATPLDVSTDRAALAYDFDQDEDTDLVVERNGQLVLHRAPLEASAGTELPGRGVTDVLLVTDIEQDGDLDLLLSRDSKPTLLRHLGDGRFEEAADVLGEPGDLAAAESIDIDNDGDLDLALATADGLMLLLNRRQGQMTDVSSAWGLDQEPAATQLTALDVDASGTFDLLALGNAPRLLRNDGRAFRAEPLAGAGPLRAGTLADLDNDGDLDLAALDPAGALELWGNREGRFERMAVALPDETRALGQVLAHDHDDDGDLDLVLVQSSGSIVVLPNEVGNRNHWIRLSLRGLNNSNAKNNTQGLFARIEVRSGTTVRTYSGNGGVNHLGLGARRQADVVRVVWTNGLAQTWQQVASSQTLVETQVLKGSCPFLYTWNGEGFSFATDLMWRSTLGMRFPDGSAAPHQPARDYVHLPSSALAPAGDELWLQVTDELWETIYVDEQHLLAYDVPLGSQLLVDESFGPPPFPTSPPAHLASALIAPRRALGPSGRDVTRELAERDGARVTDVPRTRFQGVAEPHTLRLEFPPLEGELPSHLALWGWIFPADTTINVALSQDPQRSPRPPRALLHRVGRESADHELALRFPNGKSKTVLLELPHGQPGLERELRRGLQVTLHSEHELYWDRAALTVTSPTPAPAQLLRPHAGDLHYRGFGALLPRVHSEPHRFDYERVSTGRRYPPMPGNHTRYGDVTAMLQQSDDRYVIMSPGDELTLRYPTPRPPAAGTRREYVLFTNGWVKDADLHTTASEAVTPLPFHGMDGYPPHTAGPPALQRTQDDALLRTRREGR